MIEIGVFVVHGIPLVRLKGTVTERSGAALAAEVMSRISYMTEDAPQCRGPLSLVEPCVRGVDNRGPT